MQSVGVARHGAVAPGRLQALGRPAQCPMLRPACPLRHQPFQTLHVALRTARWACRARSEQNEVLSEQNLEVEMETFMKRQAEIESGAAFARSKDTDVVIGGDIISEEMAKGYCRDVFEILKSLKKTRDMSVNEVKLVISIEDPRAREKRLVMGLEDERGVARDEVATALAAVAEGRIPKDRIALRCLHEEITGWPFLDRVDANNAAAGGNATPTPAPEASDYAALSGGRDTIVRPYIMGTEARQGDKPKGIADMLPPWVGISALYGISAIPVFLAGGCVLILFFNSLK